MTKYYRIIFEKYDTKPKGPNPANMISDGTVSAPSNSLDFGIQHEQQIELIQEVQEKIIELQADQVSNCQNNKCTKCTEGVLRKHGYKTSWYYDIFTDHRVRLPRRRCNKCAHVDGGTVVSLVGQSLSGELIKIQSQLGAQYSYRDSEGLMDLFSHQKRRINNHEKIHSASEQVGAALSELHSVESAVLLSSCAKELIVHVDGGHIKSVEDDKRSFEAMTACVYKPESIKQNKSGTKNHIVSKHCAASAMLDSQEQMKRRTIIAALKEGLTSETKITALCDGAENCWNIVDALQPLASSVTKVLDWFHLSMKIHNIALPEEIKPKLIKVKWHLWRGKTARALQRLTELLDVCSDKYTNKIKKLILYIENNSSKIVDYRERQKHQLPFTSHLAESTVESLINQRCKGQKHMRWSREGLDPILQIRAAIASGDWSENWKTVVQSI
jgi:hypothetical protein